jgi:hypothetical protein
MYKYIAVEPYHIHAAPISGSGLNKKKIKKSTVHVEEYGKNRSCLSLSSITLRFRLHQNYAATCGSRGDNFSPRMPCQWYVRGGGEGKRRILIGQSVPPPLLEWHSDVLSCHLRSARLIRCSQKGLKYSGDKAIGNSSFEWTRTTFVHDKSKNYLAMLQMSHKIKRQGTRARNALVFIVTRWAAIALYKCIFKHTESCTCVCCSP